MMPKKKREIKGKKFFNKDCKVFLIYLPNQVLLFTKI